jgi:hypothetical protein
MICKQTQEIIDNLLRLKTREDLAIDCINRIASDSNNKIASVQSTKKIGEIQELQMLLKAYIH